MSADTRLSKAIEGAFVLPLFPDSKYILISDCHRGAGTSGDNFLKNESLYQAALLSYFQRGFTYIELGDGDELWENRSIYPIMEFHNNTFRLLSGFHQENRFFSLYGNHDIVKRKDPSQFYESILLKDMLQKKDVYLVHGHQADVLNSVLWRLARFLVRYLFRPLEQFGLSDPTSAARNNTKKRRTEEKLTRFAEKNGYILIAGHTHRPMLGSPASPYFNTGSCVHPSSITGIEIEKRCMTLVRWIIRSRADMSLYAAREVLAGPVCIDEYS